MTDIKSTYTRTTIRRKRGRIISKKTLIIRIPIEIIQPSDLENILLLLDKIKDNSSLLKIKLALEKLENKNINPLIKVRLNNQ